MVWQDLALCDNLDIASNILLGKESRRLLLSDTRFHAAAASLLAELRIPLQGHHPQRPLAVRRPAAAGGGGAGDGQQAAPAGPRRADGIARR